LVTNHGGKMSEETNAQMELENAAMEQSGDTSDVDALLKSLEDEGGNEESPSEEAKAPKSKTTDWNSAVNDTLKELSESNQKTSAEDQPKEESEEVKDLTPEEIMKKLNDGDLKPEDNESQESADEGITIDYKGEKITLEGEKVKELAQQGYDYTQKTQKLAEERKSWEAEKKAAEEEYNIAIKEIEDYNKQFDEQIAIKQQWDFVLDAIKTDDPDLYDQIQDKYQSTAKFFKNPVVDSEIQKLRKELLDLKAQTQEKETFDTLKNFDSEMNTVKDKYKSVSIIGLKPDWGKVKTKWAETGKSVESVFLEMYGADMNKLYQSKLKLKAAQTQSQKKSPTIGSIQRTPAPSSKSSKKGGKRTTSYFEIARNIQSNL